MATPVSADSTSSDISRPPVPTANQSVAGIVQVPDPGPTCAGRIPRRREIGGDGNRDMLRARMRSIPGSAQNQGGGTLPRTGSLTITSASPYSAQTVSSVSHSGHQWRAVATPAKRDAVPRIHCIDRMDRLRCVQHHSARAHNRFYWALAHLVLTDIVLCGLWMPKGSPA